MHCGWGQKEGGGSGGNARVLLSASLKDWMSSLLELELKSVDPVLQVSPPPSTLACGVTGNICWVSTGWSHLPLALGHSALGHALEHSVV